RVAVRRPADDRLVAALGERELLRCAAGQRLAPEMKHEPVGLPVGGRDEVGECPAVGRELWGKQARELGEADEREGPPVVSLGGAVRDERGRRQNKTRGESVNELHTT